MYKWVCLHSCGREVNYVIGGEVETYYINKTLIITLYLFICGTKMPTRYNRGFYCRTYCLLDMFRAPLWPSSGAQEYYTVVAACGISCCGFQVAGLGWSWGLCVRFAGCCSILQTGHITLTSNLYLFNFGRC